MPYTPHTSTDRDEMLSVIGASSVDELFREIPADLKIKPNSLNLPHGLSEFEIERHLFQLHKRSKSSFDLVSFLGAGIYDRYIPASVGAIISRGEFLTAYTPYQPEASQGGLQTIYEFQSMIAELYGCEIANASMYDGATSMAEAAILAHGVNGRSVIAVSEAIHPHYRQVLKTYCWAVDLEVREVPAPNTVTELPASLEDCACLILGSPNFFGTIEDLAAARSLCDASKALLIVVADPVACALLKPPGAYGADIVVGEGQPLGVAQGLGGPGVGLFACRQEHIRRIPGRIVGRTKEAHGSRPGYVMTLRTREQDIRREKATSNICTNEALMALANTVYLTAVGKNGLRQAAENSVRSARFLESSLRSAGFSRVGSGKYFAEFVVDVKKDAAAVVDSLVEKGFLAGLPLGGYYKGRDSHLLVATTEKRTADEITAFVSALKEVAC